MIKRWILYIQESFSLLTRMLLSFFICLAIYALQKGMYGSSVRLSAVTLVVSTVSCYLLLLYVRVTDEFKDYNVDMKYFPDRPVPSGRISLRDLTVLKFTVAGLLIILNTVYSYAIIEFIVTYIAFYLMAKWFFMEKLISNNRLLAFATHGPMYIILYYYIAAMFLKSNNLAVSFTDTLLISLWIWFPCMVWEFSRKTFAPEDEKEGYQTYSKMIGFKASTSIANLFLIIQVIFLFLLADKWNLHCSIQILFTTAMIYFVLISLIFLSKPVSKNNRLKSTSEILNLMSYVLVSLNLILSR